jgi:hypothetical protein
MTRWETSTRAWATSAGRALAIELFDDSAIPIRPYDVGVVLWEHERVWAQIPARCSADTLMAFRAGPPGRREPLPRPQIANWLITNQRITGRLYPDTLIWWEWAAVVGMKIELAPDNEYVLLDVAQSRVPVVWTGPGVAPLAVAAIYHLYGPAALIDHPGLSALRRSTDTALSTGVH